ncbi:MAG: bleomycin resistance protein [Planctomycetota bacterium]
MPKLTTLAPVLLVRDVVASADYFRDRCGFRYDRFWGDPPDFCMVWRDGLCLMLKQTQKHEAIVPNWKVEDKLWDAYFWVDDADGLYEQFKAAGARMDYGPCDQPYGCREFGIQTSTATTSRLDRTWRYTPRRRSPVRFRHFFC